MRAGEVAFVPAGALFALDNVSGEAATAWVTTSIGIEATLRGRFDDQPALGALTGTGLGATRPDSRSARTADGNAAAPPGERRRSGVEGPAKSAAYLTARGCRR